MKRSFIILVLTIIVWAINLYAQSVSPRVIYGRFVDDSYYWPVLDTLMPDQPIYDKNAREFVFLEDTTQYPDTLRMRIVEVQTSK